MEQMERQRSLFNVELTIFLGFDIAMSTDMAQSGLIRILTQAQVTERTGVSPDNTAALEKKGEFPLRVPLTARRVGWVEAEVEEWLRARVALRDDAVRAAELRFARAPPAVRHRMRRARELEEADAPA
jgi:prophage regulatory protein